MYERCECGSSRLRLIAIYRPPGYNQESIVYAVNLVTSLQSLFNTATPILVTGDLNCPDIEWYNYTAPTDSVQNVILDFFIS